LNYFEPFNSGIDLEKMRLNPEGNLIIRKLSDMVDMFKDKEAAKKALKENPMVLVVLSQRVPKDEIMRR
jgi:oxalate decarboxylase/phosphoglucose isomerase-like protein (cupin superfamily)